jgi:uncharacterized protein (DUF1697 family)
MNTYVILLRGVMPMGKNRVPMAALRAALTGAGLADVQTYIQSGNAVARSLLDQAAIEALVHEVIAREIGADITVLARTHAQIQDILAGNPFPLGAASRTYFTMLAAKPAPELIDILLQLDLGDVQIQVTGRAIYTLYATRYSDSPLNNNYLERKLKVAATTRNFNTMTRLVEMSA